MNFDEVYFKFCKLVKSGGKFHILGLYFVITVYIYVLNSPKGHQTLNCVITHSKIYPYTYEIYFKTFDYMITKINLRCITTGIDIQKSSLKNLTNFTYVLWLFCGGMTEIFKYFLDWFYPCFWSFHEVCTNTLHKKFRLNIFPAYLCYN